MLFRSLELEEPFADGAIRLIERASRGDENVSMICTPWEIVVEQEIRVVCVIDYE